MASNPTFKWDTKQVKLCDVDNAGLPKVIKVTHGQYLRVGVTKSKHPENLYQELLLHSVQQNKKVIALALKSSQVGKIAVSDAELKLSIPMTYKGWFELMSEDGRTMRPLMSVHELAKCVNETCLVREPIKGYLADDNQQLRFTHDKIIPAGDQLKIVENKAISIPGRLKKMKFLHCINKKQEHVYLPHDTKCAFSLIANRRNTSGVHTIENLVNNFRFPVTVRIAYGGVPSALRNTKFSGILRLVSSEADETAFFMPIAPRDRKEKMIPISTSFPLKLCAAENRAEYMTNSELQELNTRCSEMVASYRSSVHVLVNMPDPGNYKSLKTDASLETETPPNSAGLRKRVVDVLFEEVDDLYGYVRDGGPPPESRLGQITGVESNDWEEPIYEFIDKYQSQDGDDKPEKNVVSSVPKTDDDNGYKAVAVTKVVNSSSAKEQSSNNNKQENHSNPPLRDSPVAVQRTVTSSHEKVSHVTSNPQAVQSTPVVQFKDKNGKLVKTKLYHNDTVLVTYAKQKSKHSDSRSGGSSGEKHSKDSKDKLSSSGSKESPGGEQKVQAKRKSMKSMYL